MQKLNAQLKKIDEMERVDKQKERVIEAVKSRPCLWDKSTLEYRDRYLKAKGWKEISKELDISEEKVKNMWDNLGDQVREIWRTEKYYSGDGVDESLEERKTWKFYRSLEFLRKVYKFRKTDSNFKSNNSLSESEDDNVTSDAEPNFNDLDMDPITVNDDSMTSDNGGDTISQSETVNNEPISEDTNSQNSNNRVSNTPGPSSQTKRTNSCTLSQSSKKSSVSHKSKQNSTKRNHDEMEEKLISHLELTSKLLNEPDDPNEKFLSYLGETLKDVSAEKRRKCEKDLLKIVNAYCDESEIRISIF